MTARRTFLAHSLALTSLGTFASLASLGALRAAQAAEPFSHAAVRDSRDLITPMQHGAKGDGIADDTAALNAMYARARTTRRRAVFLRGGRFRVSGGIDARGVATIGEGALIVSVLDSATSSNAFDWGGTDSFVTEVTFDLSNRGRDTMQGIVNAVNDASNQRFFRNRVVARTTEKSGVQSNIFGLWFLGTGLSGVFVEDNQFERCSYGVQVNNQDGMVVKVRKKPLGAPSRHIHITGNTCIDATIGVNTPHIFCSDVVIEGNTIAPRAFQLDLPLNVAHVTQIAITGNAVTSNAPSANGTLHVEDASGAVTISANTVTVLGENNGIELGLDPSVSHDAAPKTRAVIFGNHVQGAGPRGRTSGILLPDPGTVDTIVANNYVAGFAVGITAVTATSVQGNTVAGCGTPLDVTRESVLATNVFRK